MQLNNIRDPQSGLTYYDAVNQLVQFRYQATAKSRLDPDIPFFNNLFPFMPDWWGDPSLTPTQAAYAFARLDQSVAPILSTTRSCSCFGTIVQTARRARSAVVDRRSSTTCSINHSLERSRRSRLLHGQTTTRCNSACVSDCATTSRLTSTTPTAIHSITLPGCRTPPATALRSSSTRSSRIRTTPLRI